MIHKITKSLALSVVLFTTLISYSQNLISNGNFESGGNGNGFNVNSCCYTEIVPSGNSAQGNYAVTTDPFLMDNSFNHSTDHSGIATGHMLVVNGTTTAGGQRFWRAGSSGSGVCGLTVGNTYAFSYWIKSISNLDLGSPAIIGYQFNNTSNVVLVSGSAAASLPTLGWQKVVYTFTATNACVNIELWDNNTIANGNDFAIDDISLVAPPLPLSLTHSITNLTCINVNDGTIFGYGKGGILPYTNYRLSGPAITTMNSPTGFFTGLPPGTYTLAVTDSSTPTPTTVTETLITIPTPTGLTLTAASSFICTGSSTTLTATGGGPYTWSVTPNTETVPTGANPTVSPSVNATYTVNSTTSTPDNLVYNGDFFLGNTGFTSDYTYYNPTNPGLAQKAYGVVTNGNTWEPAPGICAGGDHTNGSGNMMAVDGSTVNAGNDKVWCQTVPVIPGQSYNLTYYLQALSTGNLANIEVMINGVSAGPNFAATSTPSTCSWVSSPSYTWVAGAGVATAEICFYDRNFSSAGNDFAIDDIVFRRTNTCTLPPKSITITTGAAPPAPVATTSIYICSGSTASPLTATAITGATLKWYDATGAALAGAPTPSNTINSDYFVSQTTGTCESPRTHIFVFVNSQTGTITMACSSPGANSVFFDWNNLVGGPPTTYEYTYSINGGPTSAVISSNVSSYTVNGVLPGQSVTFTINAAIGYPCISQFPQSWTCGNCVARTTPTFTLPTSICSGSAAPVLPTSSNDATPITGTWSPTTVSNTAGNTYVFTPNSSLFPCADPYSITIAVANPSAAGTLNGTQTVCVGLTTQFSSTTTGGTWSSQNAATATVNATGLVTGVAVGTTTIDYTIAATGGCPAVTISRTVTVSSPVSAGTLSGNQAICVGQNTTFIPTVSGGTWSSSNAAVASVNASGVISGLAAGAPTITYTVAGSGGCPIATATRTVTISAVPSAGVLSGNQDICIGYSTLFVSTVSGGTWSIAPSGIATVSSTGDIIGVAAGTANVSYVVNGTGGCGPSAPVARVVRVSASPNPGILSGGQSICVGGTTTFQSTVTGGSWASSNTAVATVNTSTGDILGIAAGSATIKYTVIGTGGCPNSDTSRVVNVSANVLPTFNPVASICAGTTLTALPLTSNNGITGTWTPALNNNATTEYTFTPTAGLCATIAKLTITVNQRTTPSFGLFPPLCQGDVPTVLPTVSQNAITGTWNPPAVSTTNTGTTIYTFNPTAGQCVATTLTTLSLTVVPVITPNFQPILPFCDGKPAPILQTTSPNGVDGTWSPSVINNTLSGSYLFTPNPLQCAMTQTLGVTIIPRTVPNFAAVQPFCKGSTPPVLPLTSINGIIGTWNPPVVDNTVSSPPNFPYTFTPNPNECATQYIAYITVTEPISPGFPDMSFCTGSLTPPLATISPNGISGTWNPATIDNLNTSAYEFTPDVGECAIPQTITVTINEYTLIAIDGIVTNYFDENQVITVLATDSGNYLYQLDYGPLQQSNVFTEVSAGTHVIKVVDANGCSSPLTRDVLVINFPKFFTPNNDGYNNTWNIDGLKDQSNSRIFIYNRYGKLVKEIFPSGESWDGTFNGEPLPADDYWFSVDYEENGNAANFKSHFSLKR